MFFCHKKKKKKAEKTVFLFQNYLVIPTLNYKWKFVSLIYTDPLTYGDSFPRSDVLNSSHLKPVCGLL